jgi:flagellar basal body-associated protein FliL
LGAFIEIIELFSTNVWRRDTIVALILFMSEQTTKSSPVVAIRGLGKGAIISGAAIAVALSVGSGVTMRDAHAQGPALPAARGDAPGSGEPAGSTAEVGLGTGRTAQPVHGEAEEESSLVNMSPFVVNLEDDSGEMHYLKVQVAVQLTAPSFTKAFESSTPKTRNALLFYLSSLKVADTQGLDNKKKILERVRSEVRESVGKNAIADVFLTEFVIQ